MACDFELIRFLIYEDRVLLIQKQYGRAWAMLRIDQQLGARCEMLPQTPSRTTDVLRKLNRLTMWARHFNIRTRIPEIVDWIKTGDTTRTLRLGT
jgi:hypothetical protein